MWLISLLALAATIHVYPSSASGVHNTKLYPRQEVAVKNFGYEGIIGPVNWHGIQPDYATCATGKNQSPLNLSPGDLQEVPAGAVQIEIPNNQKLEFVNDGTQVRVNIKGTTTIGGKKFALQQFHYHTPSEHRISDEYFPVEVHFVHEAEDHPNGIAVIGFLFQLTCRKKEANSGPSAIFSKVIRAINRIPNPGDSTLLPPPNALAVREFLSAVPRLSFYTYSGSLTTPPCSEDVTWLVAKDTLSMEVSTFNDLKAVVKFNSRFVQGGLGNQNLISLAADQLAALG